MSTKFYTPGCCTGKMLFAVENNESKIIKSWFFAIQSGILNYSQFTKLGKIKGMDVI